MKHLAKRTLTLALVLAMLISSVAVTALADDILIAPNPNANVHVLEASALKAFAAGAKKDGDTEIVEDYFTLLYSEKTKIDKSEKTWEDDYASAQRVNFGGKATTEKNAVKFTTSGPATVKIWWAQAGDDNREYAILDSAGKVVVKTSGKYEKNKAYMSTLELTEAGTYFLGGETNNNYLFKLEVTETVGSKAPRADWADVALPVIKSAEVDPKAPGTVNVTVTGAVGYDAADQITVIMRDADGWQLKSLNSLAEKDEHVLSFTPEESGTYVFYVAATREKETAVHKGEKTAQVEFTYPLETPIMKYAVNDGKGGLTVEWNPVKEATGYVVTAGNKTVTTTGLNATKATVEGLKIGDKVKVTVKALRDKEVGKDCEAMETTVSDKPEVAWVFSVFGQSTSTKPENSGCEVKDDGSVRIYTSSCGKIQPDAQDGLAMYYTTVDPKTTNFVLTATATVNSWTYTNGQEGFGLIVMDTVGVHGKTDPVYCNSYMAVVTKFDYTVNGQKITMRQGVGALERSGVTEKTSTQPDSYTAAFKPLESYGVGTGVTNILGACANPDAVPGKTMDPALTVFKLKLEKDDKGYHVSYTDKDGKTTTVDYDDPTALNYSDPDNIYIGLFSARNVDVTFSDISFTTSAASGAATPGDGKEKTVAPSYAFQNPTVSNRASFALDFRANADGKVVITDAAGTELYKGVVKAGEKIDVPVTLAKGANTFKAVMTPDAGFTVDGAKLSSYEAATVSVTVNYAVDSRSVIYVSPNGKADAAGTKAAPTTLAAAVKNPAPGATIILLAGTYKLTSGVTIDRGINGTEEKPITLMAAADANTRPVLDWCDKGNGLRLNGDWWILRGFDSTNSTGKGVHIGGNHNVAERLCTYHNYGGGLSLSRINFGESIPDWPSYNTVRNCSSWLNADAGEEDADGFEAKLTVGEGNVFDGCIAAYNADDGWDLYARGAKIGKVTIKNSVAFRNGYRYANGVESQGKGNGNGFKLGGLSIPVDHLIENSLAFGNKANGFTCNSNPNLQIVNCTAYDNGKGNLALYTGIPDLDTAFKVSGFISFKGGSGDSIAQQGAQVKKDYLNDTNFYQGHISGDQVSESWFKSLDTAAAIKSGITRNDDGTISLNGYLELTDKAPQYAGARLPGAQSQNFRDIVKGSWYYDAVLKITKLDWVKGTSPTTFTPNGSFSRAEMAVILHRMANTPKATAQSKFKDTDRTGGKWYIDAVDWANEKGYMTGGGDGTFRPGSSITRQEMVKTLYVYAKAIGVDVSAKGSTTFKDDAKIAPWARDAMAWAFASGVIRGDGTGNANPEKTATRGDMAVIIARFADLLDK